MILSLDSTSLHRGYGWVVQFSSISLRCIEATVVVALWLYMQLGSLDAV